VLFRSSTGTLVTTQQQRRFEPTVAPRDEPAAIGYSDGRSPAVAFDHCGDGGDLGGAVGVWLFLWAMPKKKRSARRIGTCAKCFGVTHYGRSNAQTPLHGS